MVYNTLLTFSTFLQTNITLIKNIFQIHENKKYFYTIQRLHILYILKEINILTLRTFFNNFRNFTMLCNKLNNETPLIVMKDGFLLAIANIT